MKLKAGERCDECPLCQGDHNWICRASPTDMFNRHREVDEHVWNGTRPEWCSPFTIHLPASFEDA
jgi:hypothetical protein